MLLFDTIGIMRDLPSVDRVMYRRQNDGQMAMQVAAACTCKRYDPYRTASDEEIDLCSAYTVEARSPLAIGGAVQGQRYAAGRTMGQGPMAVPWP